MAKKQSKNRKNIQPASQFLRRPSVQIGIVLVVAMIIALIAIFANNSTPSKQANEIDTSQAFALYEQKSAFFVDVREQDEWDSFHVPATTHIPLGELADRLNEVPKDRKIVVICRSGNRSQEGRDILIQAGYTDVISMAGGLNNWKSLGYPIEP